jgi:hypothetical protein
VRVSNCDSGRVWNGSAFIAFAFTFTFALGPGKHKLRSSREQRHLPRLEDKPSHRKPDATLRSRGTMRPSFAQNLPPGEGVGNAGCPLHPQPRVVCRKHAR